VAGAAWGAWAYAVPHYTKVPKVLGMQPKAAERRLDAAGLDVRFGPTAHTLLYAQGTVAVQSIDPGSKARSGTDVVLRLSSGPPLRRAPALAGKKFVLARKALLKAGFRVRPTRQFSDEVPKGVVIRQTPAKHRRIPLRSVVTLTVSAGPEPVTIPTVTGRDEGTASDILDAAGFAVHVERRFSTTVPRDQVISQDPASGKEPRGSPVTIVVSRGPRTFPMPDVRGMSEGAAKSQLESLGLSVSVSVVPGSNGSTVRGQNPKPGVTVQAGQHVTIYVA
jgi:serine/threonine-protein kinase